MHTIILDGKPWYWREILRLRREQKKAMRELQQPTLFELHEDIRPALERTASDRYACPSLFDGDGIIPSDKQKGVVP